MFLTGKLRADEMFLSHTAGEQITCGIVRSDYSYTAGTICMCIYQTKDFIIISSQDFIWASTCHLSARPGAWISTSSGGAAFIPSVHGWALCVPCRLLLRDDNPGPPPTVSLVRGQIGIATVASENHVSIQRMPLAFIAFLVARSCAFLVAAREPTAAAGGALRSLMCPCAGGAAAVALPSERIFSL